MKDDTRRHPFRDSHQDRDDVKLVPDTPQTRSPAYALAFADDDFMCRDELRPVRLQLELLKPELMLDEQEIISTVVMFGGRAYSRARQKRYGAHKNTGRLVQLL